MESMPLHLAQAITNGKIISVITLIILLMLFSFFVTERELGRGGKGVVLLVKHMIDHVSLGNFACKRVPVGI